MRFFMQRDVASYTYMNQLNESYTFFYTAAGFFFCAAARYAYTSSSMPWSGSFCCHFYNITFERTSHLIFFLPLLVFEKKYKLEMLINLKSYRQTSKFFQ